jgi:SAM-dependent methyltransferase
MSQGILRRVGLAQLSSQEAFDGASGREGRLLNDSYNRAFYKNLDGSARSAAVVVPILLGMTPIRSVCDVGCGTGAWLASFMRNGVSDVLGLDGDHVPRDLLRIPAAVFQATNLLAPLRLNRRFDLAVCLEVAEHLPPDCAGMMIDNLTRLAPLILFSAAIPGQGGVRHVNEQWPDYWDGLFAARAYTPVDVIRWAVWDNSEVDFWYRQNSMLYAKEPLGQSLPGFDRATSIGEMPRRVVHPGMLELAQSRMNSLSEVTKRLPSLIAAAIRRRLTPK